MANVDPNEVIQDLSIQLAQSSVQLSMTRIALKNTEAELDAANTVIAKHKMADVPADGV